MSLCLPAKFSIGVGTEPSSADTNDFAEIDMDALFESDVDYREVEVCTKSDDEYEEDEEFTLELQTHTDATEAREIGSPSTVSILIVDDATGE